MKDEGNNIIVKVVDRDDIEVGDVVYAVPNPSKVHFFDAETEVTLMNKIPPYNTIAATLKGDEMELLDAAVAVPPVFKKALNGADSFELTVPPYAIVKGDDFHLKVARIEKVDDKRLAYLAYGDGYIFALVDEDVEEGDEYGFALLNEKATVCFTSSTILVIIR